MADTPAGLLNNRYALTTVIRSGGMATITRAFDTKENCVVAIKRMKPAANSRRQYAALDAVEYDRAVNTRLKAIVADPEIAQAPIELDNVSAKDPKLDSEKVDVLKKALGEFELLAIEGPPGTGKTALIAEIIVQWLERHPKHRILLASQTHIALDNVLDRVSELGAMPDVVRIGRADDPRIADSAKPFILEHKVERWIAEVRTSAEKAMAKWADAHGVDRSAVTLGMQVELLIRIADIATVIRRQAGNAFSRDILALKRIVRRANVFRSAVALVFRNAKCQSGNILNPVNRL
ncbi:MAG: hypothetical protein GEV13_17760 [Rhodospirillales bacterium]|nr:hypothetical protein [Rhodospirillales bacterium]